MSYVDDVIVLYSHARMDSIFLERQGFIYIVG